MNQTLTIINNFLQKESTLRPLQSLLKGALQHTYNGFKLKQQQMQGIHETVIEIKYGHSQANI